MRWIVLCCLLFSGIFWVCAFPVCAQDRTWFGASSAASRPMGMNTDADGEDYVDLVRRNLKLTNELNALRQQYGNVMTERDALIVRIKELQAEKTNLLIRAESLRALPEQITPLKARIEEVNERLTAATQERDQLQKRFDLAQERLSSLDDIIAREVQKRLSLSDGKKTEIFLRLQEEKKAVDDKLSQSLFELEKTKTYFAKELRDFENRASKAESASARAENQLAQTQDTLQKQKERSALEIQKARKDNETLESNVRSLSREKQMLEAKLKNMGQRQIALEAESLKWKRVLEQKDTLLRDKDSRVQVLLTENKKLGQRADAMAKDQEIVRHKKEALEQNVGLLQRQAVKERVDRHYNLAVVFDQEGRYDDAEREYLACLVIDPEDPGVHYNLGILYDDKINNNRKAIQHYRKFLELHPMGQDAARVRQWILQAEQEQRLGPETR